jgi:hypothetical protein
MCLEDYKLLPKPRPKNLDYNSYKNTLIMQRIEPKPIQVDGLLDQNPRPMFEAPKSEQSSLSLSVARPVRSESPAAKRTKTHDWAMDGNSLQPIEIINFSIISETINIYEYFNNKQEECWSTWRDFEGRRVAPEKPALLYPDLQLSERSAEPVPGVKPPPRHSTRGKHTDRPRGARARQP